MNIDLVIPLSHQTSSHYVLENVAERAQTVCERSGRSGNVLQSVYELHGRVGREGVPEHYLRHNLAKVISSTPVLPQ